MSPVLDPAVGSSASDVTCAAYAVALAVTAAVTWTCGQRWLTRS